MNVHVVAAEPPQEGRSDLFAAFVSAVQSASPAEVLGLIEDFLTATDRMNKSIAAGLCRDFKADRNTWLDEAWQRVRESAWVLLKEIAERHEFAAEVDTYRGLLIFRSRSAWTKFIDSSSGFNQASGLANLKRRRRELERTRQVLLSRGIDPTDQQIVDETNRRMRESRSDAARQGMICSLEDLHFSEVAENIEDHAHPVSADTVESDTELNRVERRGLVLACIAACDKENALLGQVARLWFAPALDDTYDDHPTAAWIATQVGVEASTARAKVAKVRQIAQKVARVQFGLRQDE